MDLGGPGPRGRGLTVVAAALVAAVLLIGPGTAVGSSATNVEVRAGAVAIPSNETGLTVNVTWNGVGIDYADGAATAFALGPGATAQILFAYAVSPSASPPTNASLLLRYLAATLSTESIRTTTVCPAAAEPRPLPCTGSAELNWTFGSLIYLTAGLYAVDAELLSNNGTLLFREPFYIDAEAPYAVGSVTIVVALVLGAAEAYWIVASIQYRLRRRRGVGRR